MSGPSQIVFRTHHPVESAIIYLLGGGVSLSDLLFVICTFGLMAVLLIVGVPFPFAMGMGAVSGLVFGLDGNLYPIRMILWNVASNSTYLSIALFLLMAEILVASRISGRFYESAITWLNRIPGRLLHVNIVASTVFAATSGSSAATAAAFGKAAHAEGQARGYPVELNMGSLAGGATLGILIPPSVPMIVYGILTGTSIAQLFMAGIVPGILVSCLFIVFILLRSVGNPRLLPTDTARYTWNTRFKSILGLLPWMILIGGVLGVIYAGIATPTEAAAVGVIISLALALGFRTFSWKALWSSMTNAASLTAMVVLLIIGGSLLSFAYTSKGITSDLVALVTNSSFSPALILALICLLYLVLGSFLDTYSILVLTVPLLFPVTTHLGFNPVWLGILLVMLVEIGLITPPFGINLFILDGVAGGGQFENIVKGALPYCFILLLAVVLVIVFPSLALWLPSQMGH